MRLPWELVFLDRINMIILNVLILSNKEKKLIHQVPGRKPDTARRITQLSFHNLHSNYYSDYW
ncbi:hypothetical protein SMSP2_01464 [Limihaloglobus sulfuriphilus]|uniref:Uncharacterized protein n=1 Tax=Limihaloglobus sulfuriphilus TaxID=1851148 RepID=A0A1Q2MEK2_9BACT|nr:hypothetical protein SMSP2_01464 [Limihaloglobus sulfuriphilus]